MPVTTAANPAKVFMTIPRLKTSLLFVLLFIAGASCRNQNADFVPNVLVDLTLNLNNPSYQPVTVVGGHLFMPTQGYRGIVIYRANINEFQAFDMACTYRPLESCHVVALDSATSLLKCACCDSRFNFEGQLLQGPAGVPLKAYRTLYQPNTNTLQISN